MYTHNEIGPWPIIDIAMSKIFNNTAATKTTIGNALKVCLDSANLGSKSEAFVNCLNTSAVLPAANEQIAYGIALCPAQSITPSTQPIFVEFSGSCSIDQGGTNTGHQILPFIGYIDDSASATLAENWGADNLITNYIILPSLGNNNTVMINQEIVLKSINSGELDLTQYIVTGFIVRNTYGASEQFDNIEYMLSARYATKSINTIGRGI